MAPRLSGNTTVDAILVAARTDDAAAMAKHIVYSPMACGIDYTPPCPAGAAVGTPVEALSISTCHGGYALPAEAPQQLVQIAKASLYAVVKPEPPGAPPPQQPFDPTTLRVLMLGEHDQPIALTVTDRGVTGVSRGCGIFSPEWLSYGTNRPNFLLPPP
jgi:hypothetical protein